jgi:hypothetical protein
MLLNCDKRGQHDETLTSSYMNLLKNINLVERFHALTLSEKTGTPKQLAEQLGITRQALYLWIDELKSLNFVIAYSRKRETFYYKKKKNYV